MNHDQVSVVICAYNEAPRIGNVLACVADHPLAGEVIVVDDGSSDGTAEAADAFGVRVLRNGTNRGKSWSLARGVGAARLDHVMLLDADLAGLTPEHVSELAAPVLASTADAAISLRRDSFFRALGLDFVSGERVLPRAVLSSISPSLRRASRWGAELLINDVIIEQALRLAVVDWRSVTHASKLKKTGLTGALADVRMAGEIVSQLKAAGVLRHTLALRRAAGFSSSTLSSHIQSRHNPTDDLRC